MTPTGFEDVLLRGNVVELDGQVNTRSAFVSQLVTLVMTAAAVYSLVVLPAKTLPERRARGGNPARRQSLPQCGGRSSR